MKKQALQSVILLSILFPLYGYAEDVTSAKVAVVTKETVKEVIKEAKEKNIETETVKDEKEATTTEAVVTSSPEKNFTLCSQEAIENRDTRIATSRSLYNTAMANALTDRKNKEKAAVALVDESKKKAAIKLSVDAYKSLVKTAQNNLTTSRKAAWQDFENDISVCRDIQTKELEALATENTIDPLNPEASSKKETGEESTLIKDTIKAGLDSLKSLFN